MVAIGCIVVAVIVILRLVTHSVRRSSSIEAAGQVLDGRQALQPSATAKSVRAATAPFFVDTSAGPTVAIVGESYHKTALRAMSDDDRRRGETVVFEAIVYAEPTNAYDPNAVRIDDTMGRQLGHLSTEDAQAYRQVFAARHRSGRAGQCRARLIGGTPDKPSIGVIRVLEETELTGDPSAVTRC